MKTTVSIQKLKLKTYTSPDAEELPMFALNRSHQRTSGNPYPSRVVLKVNRETFEEKEYELIVLENAYIEVGILPEIGGRIFYAFDKTNSYDFFYRQHVIKPALIGALGNWISGGIEFNWPYHHKASGFMPVDYKIVEDENGVTVWLTENEPTFRISGTVGVRVENECALLETIVRLDNATPHYRPFLWWENAAVPANEQYELFFPHDVKYVNFHYKRSVTTYPFASNAYGTYNVINFKEITDISKHKNTRRPTSYFAAPSRYDFFGGYDSGKRAGVVHVADNNISPGKKMFTWAYNQLSKSWENALTDTDGAYCELMAGVYSDNQPDFAEIAPYENKSFSQFWYPISDIGSPDYANIYGALKLDGALKVYLNRPCKATIKAYNCGKEIHTFEADFLPGKCLDFGADILHTVGTRIVIETDGKKLIDYLVEDFSDIAIPDIKKELPDFNEVLSAQTLTLMGRHVDRYLDPCVLGDTYYKEALKRDPEFIDALTGLGRNLLIRTDPKAKEYLDKAISVTTQFNMRPDSGKLFYLSALSQNEPKEAYRLFRLSAWNNDTYASAMTEAGLTALKLENYSDAAYCFSEAAKRGSSYIAEPFLCYLKFKSGQKSGIIDYLEQVPYNRFGIFIAVLTGEKPVSDLIKMTDSDPCGTALDIAQILDKAGLRQEIIKLLKITAARDGLNIPTAYVCRYYGVEAQSDLEAFPLRDIEQKALLAFDEQKALYLLGCKKYNARCFDEAFLYWNRADGFGNDYKIKRALAVAHYTVLQDKKKALQLMNEALKLKPHDEQLIFETVYLMSISGIEAEKRLKFLNSVSKHIKRDDIILERATALIQQSKEEEAIKLLDSHVFVPCEGGEHAVADRYIQSYILKGIKLMAQEKYAAANDVFIKSFELPKTSGAGLWSESKEIPSLYLAAVCAEKTGNKKAAEEIYNNIISVDEDFFSKMYLKELFFFQALSYRRLGLTHIGDAVINKKRKVFNIELKKEDPGFFEATPFFLSFIDSSARRRESFYKYMLALCDMYAGKDISEQISFLMSIDPRSTEVSLLKAFMENIRS